MTPTPLQTKLRIVLHNSHGNSVFGESFDEDDAFKQILALLTQYISEAKPESLTVEKPRKPIRMIGVPVLHEADEGYNQGIDEYHANLLKGIGEK